MLRLDAIFHPSPNPMDSKGVAEIGEAWLKCCHVRRPDTCDLPKAPEPQCEPRGYQWISLRICENRSPRFYFSRRPAEEVSKHRTQLRSNRDLSGPPVFAVVKSDRPLSKIDMLPPESDQLPHCRSRRVQHNEEDSEGSASIVHVVRL